MNKVLGWIVFVLVILATYLLAGPTSLGGPASYVVVTGTSMEPTYRDGDLVIALEAGSYRPGQAIVYDAPIGEHFSVVHRIVRSTEGGYVTQGDNRAGPDEWIAPRDAIYGAVRFHIPHGGTVLRYIRQPVSVFATVAGLLTFAILKKSSKETPPSTEGGGQGGGGASAPAEEVLS